MGSRLKASNAIAAGSAASGVRDTARVLHVSPTTVIKELKKKNLRSTR